MKKSNLPYHVVASAQGAVGIQFIGRIGHSQAALLIKNLRDEINIIFKVAHRIMNVVQDIYSRLD